MEIPTTLTPYPISDILKKEFEINTGNKIYKLFVEVDADEIIFSLEQSSEISYYSYAKKMTYNNIIKELNISKRKYNDITKLFNYFDIKQFKLIDNHRSKKLIFEKKYTITLDEIINKNIISKLINEMKIIKDINKEHKSQIDKLMQMNMDKENKIKDLQNKVIVIQQRLDKLEGKKKKKLMKIKLKLI